MRVLAGETAAGKSTLINLLLGGLDLLPSNQLGCTSTIVEIRKSQGDKKEAVAFYRYHLNTYAKDTNKIYSLDPLEAVEHSKGNSMCLMAQFRVCVQPRWCNG